VAHILEHKPSKILLLSNKESHADEAREKLREYGDADKVQWIPCDLQDLKDVDRTARQLVEDEKDLNVVVCNAGIGVAKYEVTKDGIGTAFEVR
jgi:WW domain-containing oxidoreductase